MTNPANERPRHDAGREDGAAAHGVGRFVLATRPAFLTASALPVILGNLWGAGLSGSLDPVVLVLSLAATVLVHSGANVLNDVFDDISGADVGNDARIHPYTGGSRVIQDGVIERSGMAALGTGLIAGGVVLGLLLAWMKGWPVVYLGIVGVALGVAYTAPPLKLSYRGWGEVTVAIAFGLLPIVGAVWLQSGAWSLEVAALALPVSLWVAAILLINEVPDAAADGAAGKLTLPARFGRSASLRIYQGVQVAAAIAVLAIVLVDILPVWAALVPLPLALGAALVAAPIRDAPLSSPELRRRIEMTLGVHAIGTIWLTVASVIG